MAKIGDIEDAIAKEEDRKQDSVGTTKFKLFSKSSTGLSKETRSKTNVDVLDERYRPLTFAKWFVTFMCIGIPIVGLLYLIGLSISKNQTLKRDFARAYLLYQFIFLAISVVLVIVFCYYGLEIADNALKFMQEL